MAMSKLFGGILLILGLYQVIEEAVVEHEVIVVALIMGCFVGEGILPVRVVDRFDSGQMMRTLLLEAPKEGGARSNGDLLQALKLWCFAGHASCLGPCPIQDHYTIE